MNGRHSEQPANAWGPTAAAAAVACLPPVALAAGLSGAGFGLALDSTPIAASGAVAATVGIVAQRNAGRRLRRRLRQERARNRLEVHDLHLRLEQATRHLAEAVALAEAATRAMSGAPLVLAEHGRAVLDAAAAAAQQPVDEPVELPESVAQPELEELPVDEPVELPRRAAAETRAVHDVEVAAQNAALAGRVAHRLSGPAAAFGSVVVPATPADLFTPSNGLPIPETEHDWFAPVRSTALPPAPPSPAIGIALAAAATGAARPPGPRDPVSGPIALPARLADAKVVDLSLLAVPAEPALIVVRRGRRAEPAGSR